jgi:copper resistance protein C
MLKRTYLNFSVPVGALLLAVAPAFAHSHPITMVPAKDATVTAPTEVSVTFSEALEPKFSSLQLVDDKHTVVSKAVSVVDPADAKHQTLALPKLPPGVYTVHWVTTALDGHRLEGNYSFTIK